MEEIWNFKNFIGIPLEKRGERIFGADAWFSADQIQDGSFVDAMLKILSTLPANPHELKAFSKKCSAFAGKTALEIGNETAKVLFEEFERIYRGVNK